MDSEAADPQLRRGEHLERIVAPNERLGVLGESDAVLHHRSKRRHTEGADREPHFEGAGVPGELLAVIGEVDLFLAGRDILEVLGEDVKGVLETRGLASEKAATLEGDE